MNDSGLLEKIAIELKMPYLSDLKSASAQDLDIAINSIEVQQYGIEQWNYALTYILEIEIEIEDYSDIEKLVKKYKK